MRCLAQSLPLAFLMCPSKQQVSKQPPRLLTRHMPSFVWPCSNAIVPNTECVRQKFTQTRHTQTSDQRVLKQTCAKYALCQIATTKHTIRAIHRRPDAQRASYGMSESAPRWGATSATSGRIACIATVIVATVSSAIRLGFVFGTAVGSPGFPRIVHRPGGAHCLEGLRYNRLLAPGAI